MTVLQRGGKGESRRSEFFSYRPHGGSAGNGGAPRRNRENEGRPSGLNSGGTVGSSHPESNVCFPGHFFCPEDFNFRRKP